MFSKTWFFRNFPASDGSDFYSTGILHHNIILFKKKKKNFVACVFRKPGFSETSRPWMVLGFIAHLERTLMVLYIKEKQNLKKKIFGLGKGGVPLTVLSFTIQYNMIELSIRCNERSLIFVSILLMKRKTTTTCTNKIYISSFKSEI